LPEKSKRPLKSYTAIVSLAGLSTVNVDS
jgi:hypothetical protein